MLRVDLRLRRGSFSLELAFEAPDGFTVLYGPSGAGKSSVLDLIAGALSPDEGWVELDGERLVDRSRGIEWPAHRRRTPRVYQEGRLFPHRSVRSNLRYGHRSGRGPSLDDVARALEIESLLDRAPLTLSGGQRQRVAVGRALLAGPRALLLDEPLASLDRELRHRILPHLRRWQRHFQVPFVYVTHSAEEALLLADRVIHLENGRLQAEGPPAEILAHGEGAPEVVLHEGDTVLGVEVVDHRPSDGLTLCRLGSVELRSLLLPVPVGRTALLALSSRDLLLGPAPPSELRLSARNHLPCRLRALAPEGGSVRVELELVGAPAGTPCLRTVLTTQAAREMGLGEGRTVGAIFKGSALRLVGLRDD